MFTVKNALLATAVACLFSATAYAEQDGHLKKDAQAINTACKSEAATAGCGEEVVGKGLLKCLHAYKKAHSDFKFSEGCHDALKQFREDVKEMKEEREQKK